MERSKPRRRRGSRAFGRRRATRSDRRARRAVRDASALPLCSHCSVQRSLRCNSSAVCAVLVTFRLACVVAVQCPTVRPRPRTAPLSLSAKPRRSTRCRECRSAASG
jgi:hypothetical protein